MDPNVEKFCALTFDDGPANGQTDEVLDQLEKYKVPATFFIVGQRINDSTRKVLERAASLGCEFGNHSWDYSGMNTMSADKVKDYISKTSALIEKYTGKKPAFFRPPNLATSDTMFQNIELVFAGGVVCMDWEQTTTADQRAGYILNGAKDGAILLLHDVQPEPHPTPEALDIIIPELKARGYTFLTLSELFAKKGYTDLTAVPKRLWQYVK
ncbi:MAG: polysaccharide deacetylase family protein [Spirochaetales bacterium]|nr:polysaccharide deacetylase family protein [Spirochaetales bacterium]